MEHSFHFKLASANDVHTTVNLFAGPAGRTLGLAGRLILRNEEWADLCEIFRDGEPLDVRFDDDGGMTVSPRLDLDDEPRGASIDEVLRNLEPQQEEDG